MSEKTTEKEWEIWMDNLIIEDVIKKENIPFYQYSEFENVKLIVRNVYEATFKTSQKTVALKCVCFDDKFTQDDLINEIKRHRKLEIHDSILKFYGITRQENTNIYIIILEHVNDGSLRQYLKTNFQKMDWNIKLNLAKQIANVLMCLHSNDIIHGKLNSENILIHNGNIKLNVFGLTKIMSESLRFLKNHLGPRKYMDSQYLELCSTIGKNKSSDIFGLGIILWEISSGNPPFEMESLTNVDFLKNIVKGKRERAIPGTPQKYEEIYTDCWSHNKNSRPDIFQVVKILSEIIISNANVEFETPQSQPYKVTDEIIAVQSVQLEKSNKQSKNLEVKLVPPFVDASAETVVSIKDLFEFFVDIQAKQVLEMHLIIIKNHIREHKKNPAKILYEMIRFPSHYWFTSLIGFFYLHGIGTVIDSQMAFKFFNLAANKIIDIKKNTSSNLLIRKYCNINKEIGNTYIAHMYLDGTGIEKDLKKGFQIYSKVADEGSYIALNCMGYCYGMGFGVEKREKMALQLYLKSAEKGNLVALSNVGYCCEKGMGIAKDETKGFQCRIKSALAGNINAAYNVGCFYDLKDEKNAFKWFLEAAEKGYPLAQYYLGDFYEMGYGIDRNKVKAFEWFKKAAGNNCIASQYTLGKCFYEGNGTKKDLINAIYWLNKAKENGNMQATILLEAIIDIMQ
ncbi:hypothetical protein Glove_275g42 [Diversispora epigaea]|uniref:Protein kinase domain-containing protein n=1 Tax=Diversispora epigaea TaxID=1348612 RepID=A0A397I782_9GLOM|nr:hypothetical protein Glove_275g42 [Diversispora epigaea]